MTDTPQPPTKGARQKVSVRLGRPAVARLQRIADEESTEDNPVTLTDVVRVALALALEKSAHEIRTRLRNRT